MITTREKFVEHYLVLYQKELLDKLPKRTNTTNMLHKAGQIIHELNAHLLGAILQNMKGENEK